MRIWSKLDVYKNAKAKIILQKKNGEVIKALKIKGWNISKNNTLVDCLLLYNIFCQCEAEEDNF